MRSFLIVESKLWFRWIPKLTDRWKKETQLCVDQCTCMAGTYSFAAHKSPYMSTQNYI